MGESFKATYGDAAVNSPFVGRTNSILKSDQRSKSPAGDTRRAKASLSQASPYFHRLAVAKVAPAGDAGRWTARLACSIETTTWKQEDVGSQTLKMHPITFECRSIIPRKATEICSDIANVSRWSEFKGYGILPGIARAEYENRTNAMVASRVRVYNSDGSEHIEEIREWDFGKKIVMKLYAFTPPLNRLSTHFIEEWSFEAENNTTLVTRKFEMFPKQPITRPFLWLISLFFKRAIALHLAEMVRESGRKAA